VCELTLAAIRDTARLAEHFAAAAPDCAPCVIANKTTAGRRGEIARSEFERGIGMAVAHTVPWDARTAARAANEGKAVGAIAGRSELARAIARTAEALAGTTAAKRSRFRLRNWIGKSS